MSFEYLFDNKKKIKSQLFNFKQCYNKLKSCLSVRQVKKIDKYIKKIEKELL